METAMEIPFTDSQNNKSPSIKKNYIYSTLLNFSTIFFPLITYPYIARVLGPTYVGKVVFALTFVGYFVIFGNLGLPLYGVREIAKVRHSKEDLEKKFSQLFILNLLSLSVFTIIYLIVISFFDTQEFTLYIIVGLALLLNIIHIQWFYQGIENYKFITFSNLFFQLISLLIIILFINNPESYNFYALALVLNLYGAGILNFIYCFKYSKLKFKYGISFETLKHALALFSVTIVVNIYFNLDKFLLGLLENDIYLGYYSSSIQIVRIVVVIVTSLGLVLTPRISYYIKHNQLDDFAQVARYSLLFILWIGIPATVGIYLYAKEIILIFAGDQFLEAVPALEILSPAILCIALSNFFGLQILVPNHRDKALFFASVIGLIVSLTSNLLLIPPYKHLGTAFSTLLTEFSVFFISALFGIKYISLKQFITPLIRYLAGSVGIIFIIFFVKSAISSIILSLAIGIPLSVIFYILFLLLVKDPLTYEGISLIDQFAKKYIFKSNTG